MIAEYKITDGSREVGVQIIRSSRKSIGLEVGRDETVRLRIPNRLPDRIVREFMERHSAWVFRKLEEAGCRKQEPGERAPGPVEKPGAAELERIRAVILARVSYYGERMGAQWGRVSIRDQKTRWGSCSSKGNLNFNYRIAYLPQELLDYVVVHELAHLRHMNHSEAFWREVEAWYPNYQGCRERLGRMRIERV